MDTLILYSPYWGFTETQTKVTKQYQIVIAVEGKSELCTRAAFISGATLPLVATQLVHHIKTAYLIMHLRNRVYARVAEENTRTANFLSRLLKLHETTTFSRSTQDSRCVSCIHYLAEVFITHTVIW